MIGTPVPHRAAEAAIAPSPTADEPWYTIHGGAFDIPLIQDAAFEWSAVPARYRNRNIGFRCAKDAR